MIKSKEIADPHSCLNRAMSTEYLFVLLGRDAAAGATLRFWINERIKLGKNTWQDPQILEAVQAITLMESQHKEYVEAKTKGKEVSP